MHCFHNKIFKLVKFCVVFTIAACFLGTTKSYSLVDADKVVKILTWAADFDSTVHTESWDVPIIVSIPSLSVGPFLSSSPSLPTDFAFTPIASPSLSASPFVSESPGLTADGFVISKAKSLDEKQFLLSISCEYEKFFKNFKLNQEHVCGIRLFRNSRFLQFFKYAVLVRLFEHAIEHIRLENLDEYRSRWWYGLIFSCTDDELHYYEQVYSDFEKYEPFCLLTIPRYY